MTTFTHEPRPPFLPDGYPKQRYFGVDDTVAEIGMSLLSNPRARIQIYRSTGRLVEMTTRIDSASASARIRLDLSPTELRALARCLIDAAHDAEQEPVEVTA